MPPILLPSHHWHTHFLLTITLSSYVLAAHLVINLLLFPTLATLTSTSASPDFRDALQRFIKIRMAYLYTIPKIFLTLMQVLFMYETRGWFLWQWWCLGCLVVSWLGSGAILREGLHEKLGVAGTFARLRERSWVGTAAVVGHAVAVFWIGLTDFGR